MCKQYEYLHCNWSCSCDAFWIYITSISRANRISITTSLSFANTHADWPNQQWIFISQSRCGSKLTSVLCRRFLFACCCLYTQARMKRCPLGGDCVSFLYTFYLHQKPCQYKMLFFLFFHSMETKNIFFIRIWHVWEKYWQTLASVFARKYPSQHIMCSFRNNIIIWMEDGFFAIFTHGYVNIYTFNES